MDCIFRAFSSTGQLIASRRVYIDETFSVADAYTLLGRYCVADNIVRVTIDVALTPPLARFVPVA